MSQRYTITTALPYANGPVHIGHLAGVYIPADIYARYMRMCGKDVFMIGGSDEHGVPITIQAKSRGISPQELVDKYHSIIKESFEKLGISFDVYSRTSSKTHAKTASEFFKTLYDRGLFEEKTSMQYYDEEHKQFLADRYILGKCPHCGEDNAYGDQCEKCGSSLSPDELLDPVSALSGKTPIKKETKHWYLPLNKYQEFLEDWILKSHKDDWKTNVYGQCKSWLDQGLQPRAVTRDLDWGVKLPLENSEGKVLYVWFDAPIGYISATKESFSGQSEEYKLADASKGVSSLASYSKTSEEDWKKYWCEQDTKLLHFIGKDNIVFHCIIFPSMLKAEGSYILPNNVPANEFLNLEGDKISTSRSWAVWLHEYLEEMPGKEDVLRYVLTATAPETKDNDFTWKDYQNRNNSELLAIFGNFVNRSMVLCEKYFEGKVPQRGDLQDIDKEVLDQSRAFAKLIGSSIESYRFREALAEFMNLCRLGNKYLTETEPWKIFKTDPERVATILNVSLQLSARMCILCEPFLPFTANKLRSMLSMSEKTWIEAENDNLLADGSKLGSICLLFEKIEDEVVEKQIAKLQAAKAKREAAAKIAESKPKPTIDFDAFAKVDLRVGEILSAEKMPKANKLLKLSVDLGFEKRTIVSGIAQSFSPEETIGKKVCVLVNLAPKNLKGVESSGMILLAESTDGKLHFAELPKDAEVGSQIM